MKQLKRPVLTSLFFFFALLLKAGNPVIQKQPVWVLPITVDYTATSLDDEADDGYSDLHHEKQISLAQQTVFTHNAMHVLTESGVESLSQISVDYDPSFEQLIFHSIRIIRDGQNINELQLSRIKTIQQEKELSRSIYNGTLTAILILDDLRKGDVLEYSYSIKGFNPVLKGKYAESYPVKFDVPIYGLYYRLLVPQGRNVNISNSLTGAKPTISTNASQTDYEWSIKNETPVRVEKNLPSWYDAYPMIMVSEFKSWKEINDWALELFPFSASLSPTLQKRIDEIKSMNQSVETRLLAALHFVQDEVRYTGIEMGENAHKPHAPSQVFQQRFGDCKDKAYLLCTMLRAMNIEAYPVLINTEYKKTINGWLPSPTVFDHTTACVSLNGKTYWFDATISNQRGRLEEISFPDYQSGLVVKPGTDGFTTIPSQDHGKTVSKEVFYITKMRGPVTFVVTTQFTGSYADGVRYNFRSKSVKEIQRDYKSFYTPYFKKLDADSLRYEDDSETGVFTTKEYYTIQDFWKEEAGTKTVLLEPYLINAVIKKPQEEKRTMPFALLYPARYEEEVEIHLPENWPITESSNNYKTASFAFTGDYIQLKPDVISLKYRYENLKDHIAADEVPSYLSQWDLADKGMAFQLSSDFSDKPIAASNTTDHKSDFFTISYIVLGICVVTTFLYKRKNQRKSF